MKFFRNGTLFLDAPATATNNVGFGWQHAFTWNTLTNVQAGNWTAQVFVDSGDGVFHLELTRTFTVQ